MGDQVKVQNEMIKELGNQVDKAQENLDTVNNKLSGTLHAIAASEGKCCMDIVCLLLLLGLVAFAIQIFRGMNR